MDCVVLYIYLRLNCVLYILSVLNISCLEPHFMNYSILMGVDIALLKKLLIHGHFQVGWKGFSHCFEITHHKCFGEFVDNDVILMQGERVCSRETTEVR